jgi:hypothetical protein
MHLAGPCPRAFACRAPLIVLHEPHGYYSAAKGQGASSEPLGTTMNPRFWSIFVPNLEPTHRLTLPIAIRSLSIPTAGDNSRIALPSKTSSKSRSDGVAASDVRLSPNRNRRSDRQTTPSFHQSISGTSKNPTLICFATVLVFRDALTMVM